MGGAGVNERTVNMLPPLSYGLKYPSDGMSALRQSARLGPSALTSVGMHKERKNNGKDRDTGPFSIITRARSRPFSSVTLPVRASTKE